MGKKSKRTRQHGSTTSANDSVKQREKKKVFDQLTSHDEETSDNLRFEDPFEDEYENEELDDEMETDVKENGENSKMNDDNGKQQQKQQQQEVQSWNPLTSAPLDPGTELEIDEAAYKMHHSLTPEWPALSFDILRDNLGDNRTRFPHSMIVAVGSQADKAERNKLTIMRLSDLSRTGAKERTEKELEDEMLGEEYGKDDISDEGDGKEDDDDDDDEIVDLDPILEHFSLMHNGGVNRVRAMPQQPEVVATWSDKGMVNLYNVSGILERFSSSSGSNNSGDASANRSAAASGMKKIRRDPFFVYQGHSSEGYAMDWSKVNQGHLATGDCNGHIHLWQPTSILGTGDSNSFTSWNNSSFKVTDAYGPAGGDNLDNPSVEDIQWSPTEGTVLASAECGGYVRIYDTRCPGRPMISNKIHENGADVNVISWNSIVSNLMSTGGDDGVFSVWDLRNFQSSGTEKTPNPLARFTCHRKPITSLEWHPTDESMIAVSDEDGTYIYDLSIEEDDVGVSETQQTGTEPKLDDIPPQLLFVHCGSESTKELHWHPQISSLVMTTALSGYSIFIPSNL